MNRLLEIGFIPSGHWLLQNDKLAFELIRHSTQKNILYAFVCDGQIKYVGKTIRTLAARMSSYKTPSKSQTTNIRNNHRIKHLLLLGTAVEILALPDNGLMHYGQFHMNLAAALEDSIIRVIDPEWNGGTTEAECSGHESKMATVEPQASNVPSFTITLHPTYYHTGFFNIGILSQIYLGADGETIELFLGNADQPILGSINRRANTNATPRIMGGVALRDWFKNNASENETVRVDVLSPTAIRLSTGE